MVSQELKEMVEIKTSNGTRLVEKKHIIHFIGGIPGFDDFTEFVFFDINDCEPFKSMLSVEDGGPDFVVVETNQIFSEYAPFEHLPSLDDLGLGEPMELVVLSIVTLAEQPEDITINLRGPLLINRATSRGRQIIIDDERYTSRTPILENAADRSA